MSVRTVTHHYYYNQNVCIELLNHAVYQRNMANEKVFRLFFVLVCLFVLFFGWLVQVVVIVVVVVVIVVVLLQALYIHQGDKNRAITYSEATCNGDFSSTFFLSHLAPCSSRNLINCKKSQ